MYKTIFKKRHETFQISSHIYKNDALGASPKLLKAEFPPHYVFGNILEPNGRFCVPVWRPLFEDSQHKMEQVVSKKWFRFLWLLFYFCDDKVGRLK